MNDELWVDIRTATRKQMVAAFQLRRQKLVAECAQISIDLASCNENRWPNEPIEFVFDFSRDVEEERFAEALQK